MTRERSMKNRFNRAIPDDQSLQRVVSSFFTRANDYIIFSAWRVCNCVSRAPGAGQLRRIMLFAEIASCVAWFEERMEEASGRL